MKYRSIRSMRRQIQEWRARPIPMKWLEICNRLNIVTDDGKPNYGLAQDIGFKVVMVHGVEMPYEPIEDDVRARLGLSPICPKCHRPFRDKTHRHVEKDNHPALTWWRSRKPSERRRDILYLHTMYELGELT